MVGLGVFILPSSVDLPLTPFHGVENNFRLMQRSSNQCLKQLTDETDTTDSGREFRELTILYS